MNYAELNQFIESENNFSLYEKTVSNGVGDIPFIDNCSVKILEKGYIEDKEFLFKILCLIKYIYSYWELTEKKYRLNKKFCMKGMFVLLFFDNANKLFDTEELINTCIDHIGGTFFSVNLIDLLSFDEKKKLKSKVKKSFKTKEYLQFDLKSFDKEFTDDKIKYYSKDDKSYILKMYKDLKNCNSDSNISRYLKTIFVVLFYDNEIRLEYPSILSILPQKYYIQILKKIFNKNKQKHTKLNIFIKNIYDNDKYLPLPGWASWFYNTGVDYAKIQTGSTEKIITCFLVPSLYYASLFFMLGYETEYIRRIIKTHSIDKKKYFLKMKESWINQQMLLLEGEKWKKCIYKGSSEEGLKVEVPGRNKYTKILFENNILSLFKPDYTDSGIPENQIGKKEEAKRILEEYYRKNINEIFHFFSAENKKFLIYGNKSSLKKQVEKLKLNYLKENNENIKFSFDNILRFKNYHDQFGRWEIKNNSSDFFNSEIAIYDGSISFIKNINKNKSKKQVVFLDFTETQLSDAIDIVGDMFEDSIDKEGDKNNFSAPPASIEVLSFKV
ncbi:MAG: hypothetical protein ACQESP_11995 [Candidatus Muiribacteriota bacterium]